MVNGFSFFCLLSSSIAILFSLKVNWREFLKPASLSHPWGRRHPRGCLSLVTTPLSAQSWTSGRSLGQNLPLTAPVLWYPTSLQAFLPSSPSKHSQLLCRWEDLAASSAAQNDQQTKPRPISHVASLPGLWFATIAPQGKNILTGPHGLSTLFQKERRRHSAFSRAHGTRLKDASGLRRVCHMVWSTAHLRAGRLLPDQGHSFAGRKGEGPEVTLGTHGVTCCGRIPLCPIPETDSSWISSDRHSCRALVALEVS